MTQLKMNSLKQLKVKLEVDVSSRLTFARAV